MKASFLQVFIMELGFYLKAKMDSTCLPIKENSKKENFTVDKVKYLIQMEIHLKESL